MPRVLELLGRFRAKTREAGLVRTLGEGIGRLVDPRATLPLARVDEAALFATDTDAIRAREKKRMRTASLVLDASRVDASYPASFEHDGRVLRYAHLPAKRERRGLVVLFHGHNATLHMGPMAPWPDFDLLAPWDTFGWNRQGSRFWGEQGDPFVARMVEALIRMHRDAAGHLPWFCLGSSMGGFGALYHGVSLDSDGIYVMAPQVDLRASLAGAGPDTPYGHLAGDDPRALPSIIEIAEGVDTLPPLYLVQHQFDPVNPFDRHGFRLLDVYNRKGAWYGVRIAPAIGHGGDGSQEEARLFFSSILDKRPPRRMRAPGADGPGPA